jgi:hypothetical protein
VHLCFVLLRLLSLPLHVTSDDIAAENAILLSPRTVVCTTRRARISPYEQYNATVLANAVPGRGAGGDVRVRRGWQPRLSCGAIMRMGYQEVRIRPVDLPDDDPGDTLHRVIVQMLVYRI